MANKTINQKSSLNDQDIKDALQMAISDFDKFCKYAGVNPIQLKVCIERNKNLSYGQISQKLKVPRATVKDICDRCVE
jgi:hypothetical protein